MPIIPFAATPSRLKHSLLLLSAVFSLTGLLFLHRLDTALISPTPPQPQPPTPPPSPHLSPRHLLFSIASSSATLSSRIPYIRLWYPSISHHNTTFLFLDQPPPTPQPLLPPIIVPPNSPALSAGHRLAGIVKHAVALKIPGICWYVFGDDDTVFFVENLVRILGAYDCNRWYYVGFRSESYEQNEKFWFDMAYGGGGYAISASLAEVLAGVVDECIGRYDHLFGSDARVYACLAELGVGLTSEPGFHQVDVRGDLFGMLSAHPLSLVASLHHIDAVEPIFPGKSRIHALGHLFKAVRVDPARTLQQTVCYDRSNSLTVSIAWGYAIQVYEGNQLLPDLLSFQRTFRPWKRGKNASSRYMFNTKEFPKDQCKRPVVFFLDAVNSDPAGVWTKYTRHTDGKCTRANVIQKLKVISVFSPTLDIDVEQMKAPRRHCCDISSSFDKNMVVQIRKCGVNEMIAMRENLMSSSERNSTFSSR